MQRQATFSKNESHEKKIHSQPRSSACNSILAPICYGFNVGRNLASWAYVLGSGNLHSDSVPRLKGNFLFGQTGSIVGPKSINVNKVLFKLVEMAQNHPSGMAYCWALTTPMYVLTAPSLISQLMQAEVAPKLQGQQAENPFTALMGPDNILNIGIGHPLYQIKKNKFATTFGLGARVARMLEVQTFITQHLRHIPENQFFAINNFIARVHVEASLQAMGCRVKPRDPEFAEKFTKKMDDAVATLVNPKTPMMYSITTSGLAKLFGIKPILSDEKQELHKIIKEEVLVPNLEHLKKPDSKSWFRDEKTSELDTTSESVLGDVMQVLEATPKIVPFAFVLIKKHPDVQRKIEAEIKATIEKTGKHPREWGDAEISQLRYLEEVLMEVARLYPIFSTIPRITSEEIKMKTADGKEINIPPRSYVIFSPLATHHDEKNYKKANSFDSSRFQNVRFEDLKAPEFLAWGLVRGSRPCPGRNYSVLIESKAILARVLAEYDFVLKRKDYLDNLVYSASLETKDPIEIKLIPRDLMTASQNNDTKGPELKMAR